LFCPDFQTVWTIDNGSDRLVSILLSQQVYVLG